MVLSHDANCWTDMVSEDDKRRTRPLWHYNHIPDDILPALRKAGVTEDQIEQMLVRNLRALFEGRGRGNTGPPGGALRAGSRTGWQGSWTVRGGAGCGVAGWGGSARA